MPALGALAACGSDQSGDAPGDTLPPTSESPSDPPGTGAPTSEPSDTVVDSPLDEESDGEPDAASTVVFEYGIYGGFTTRDVAFQRSPLLLVSSDGLLITPAAVPAIYPGPLLPQHTVQTISPAGIDALISAAREAGLLTDVTYGSDGNIADAGTATVRISVDGVTYSHEAYALGIGAGPRGGSESSPERQALSDFLERLAVPESVIGAEHLGAAEPYQPAAYQISAEPAGDLTFDDIEPTIVEWDVATVSLADAAGCVEVARADIGDLLDTATQLTFFRENNVEYILMARPALANRVC